VIAARRDQFAASPHAITGRRLVLLLAVLPPALALSIAVAISIGAIDVPVIAVLQSLGHHLFAAGIAAPADPVYDQIVWELRAPRTLLAAVAGGGLSIAGAVLQAVVRNPLADPYVLGVASGASFGAVLVVVVGSGAVLGLGLSLAAFLGAMLSLALVFALGQRGGRFSPARLVLAGVALAALFNAATSYLQLQADPQELQAVLFWLLGSVARAGWGDLGLPALAVGLCGLWLLSNWRRLNLLLVGEESAQSLGVEVNRFRAELLLATSLLVGTSVAVAGGIGFVGLMVPHVVRLLVGPDHRRVLPVCALLGALYLVWVDVLCRLLQAPSELPIGVITAMLGAPFFLWLLRRSARLEGAA
jgi:iron complex transport system permease protein